jgi:hypothetical protein
MLGYTIDATHAEPTTGITSGVRKNDINFFAAEGGFTVARCSATHFPQNGIGAAAIR